MSHLKTGVVIGIFAIGAAATALAAGGKQSAAPLSANHQIGCNQAYVVIQSASNASITQVSCTHGNANVVPSSSSIGPNQPGLVALNQSVGFGPDCTITVQGSSSNVATLSIQQNFCGLKAGQITASVVSGSAALIGTASGSYSSDLPGTIWFTVN